MPATPELSSVLQGSCCETCRDNPQNTLMKKSTKKNSLMTDAFSERLQQLLLSKKRFDKVAVGPLDSQFVFFEVIYL